MCAYEEATGKFFLDTVASLYDAMAPAIQSAAKQATLGAETAQGAIAGLDTGGSGTPVPLASLGQQAAKSSPFDIVRKVPMRDLRALLWAALHDYNQNNEPTWPLTINQVGRLLSIADVLPVFTAFLKGQASNQPSKDEMGESLPVAPGVAPPEQPTTPAAAGGDRSIELPDSAFV
jgi:hypothetical protein